MVLLIIMKWFKIITGWISLVCNVVRMINVEGTCMTCLDVVVMSWWCCGDVVVMLWWCCDDIVAMSCDWQQMLWSHVKCCVTECEYFLRLMNGCGHMSNIVCLLWRCRVTDRKWFAHYHIDRHNGKPWFIITAIPQ